MGRIVKQVMASSLTEAREAARTWRVGREIYGEKITKVTVSLAKTGKRPYNIVIITAKRKR